MYMFGVVDFPVSSEREYERQQGEGKHQQQTPPIGHWVMQTRVC